MTWRLWGKNRWRKKPKPGPNKKVPPHTKHSSSYELKPGFVVSVLGHMKSPKKRPEQALANGQTWKTAETYIRITEIGKTLISYKMMKQPGQRGVRIQMTDIGSLTAYLKKNAARLVKGGT
jgi:hypothetical protein